MCRDLFTSVFPFFCMPPRGDIGFGGIGGGVLCGGVFFGEDLTLSFLGDFTTDCEIKTTKKHT